MRQFLASRSSETLFDLQVQIARELQVSESCDSHEERWHRRRLRSIGDAAAWTVLTPHAIRNLSRGRAPAPSLLGQGSAFDHVLDTARSAVQDGMAVVISDVTTCIGVGDLLACGDPDAPYIIECKRSFRPEALMQGRRGRQLSRGRAIGSYLRSNRGFLPGVAVEKVAIEVPHEPAYSWESVIAAVQSALVEGSGVVARDRELIWARRSDEAAIPAEFHQLFRPDALLFIGSHNRLMDNDAPGHIAPPLTWPVPAEIAFGLAEDDVTLYHALDPSAFDGHATARARLVGVTELAPEVYGFAAEVDGEERQLGPRFLVEVLYGFETVHSAAQHMLLSLERAQDQALLLANKACENPRPKRKPRVHHLRTLADAQQFVEAADRCEDRASDVVFFGDELARELRVYDRPVPHGSMVIVGAPPGKGPTNK
jgi:hypothetical protein